MVANNNRKSNSNSTSSISKQNWSMLAFIALVVMVFAVYYVTYSSNRDSFVGEDSSSNPNLTVSSNETLVALFYADWCPHCVAFKPDYKKAMSNLNGNKYKGKTLRFVMVDCDKNKSIAKENNVSGFPTVKILNDDKTSSEYSGERSYEGLSSYFS
jgi:thiol-disulfide isomerase/thioredoxin